MNLEAGFSLNAVITASRFIAERLVRPLTSRVYEAALASAARQHGSSSLASREPPRTAAPSALRYDLAEGPEARLAQCRYQLRAEEAVDWTVSLLFSGAAGR